MLTINFEDSYLTWIIGRSMLIYLNFLEIANISNILEAINCHVSLSKILLTQLHFDGQF